MQVHVINELPAFAPDVEDELVAVADPRLASCATSREHEGTYKRPIAILEGRHGRNVSLGNDEEVRGRFRPNVVEDDEVVIFIADRRRQFVPCDSTEDAFRRRHGPVR